MRQAKMMGRFGLSIGVASLAAGCVQPMYAPPGPIQLQSYPPPVYYRSIPDAREPMAAPIPLQPAPTIEPLPPPAAPSVTEVPSDDIGGAIPVQDMPPLATDTAPVSAAPSPDGAPTAPATPAFRKAPTTGAGSNVPLEGFRPMHSQTRPAP